MAARKTRKAPTVRKAAGEGKGKRGVRISEIPGEVKLERSPFKLRGRIQYLSTDIDALRSYVLESKKVRLSDAATKFKVSPKVVEDWGKILEEHKMIDLHYPIAGEPVLKVHEPKRSWKEKKAERERLKQLEKDRKAAGTPKGTGKPAPKEGKPGKSWKPKLTRKRVLIMAEVIVLAEVLIYIFAVNPHLRDGFLPTLNYQIANLPRNVMNLPQTLSSSLSNLFGRQMVINPIFFVLGFLIVVIWIAIALIRRRKKSAFVRKWRESHEKGSEAKKAKK